MKLEEIEKLCAEATPGPWSVVESKAGYKIEPSITKAICCYVGEYPEASPEMDGLDAKFIAAGRTLMPKLLAVAKAAKVATEDRNLQSEDLSGKLESLADVLEELEKE